VKNWLMLAQLAGSRRVSSVRHSYDCGYCFMLLLRILLGRPLANYEQSERKLGPLVGVPAIRLDGLGSSAYVPRRRSLSSFRRAPPLFADRRSLYVVQWSFDSFEPPECKQSAIKATATARRDPGRARELSSFVSFGEKRGRHPWNFGPASE
jgi:hypothetical protein